MALLGQDGVSINSDTIAGQLHIATQSTTSYPHLRLTETEDDYSRIKFESTAFPESYWDIAARGGTDSSGVKRFNIYFNNGTAARDVFLLQGTGDLWRNSFYDGIYDHYFTDNVYRGTIGISEEEMRLYTSSNSNGNVSLGTRANRHLVIDTLGRIGIGTTVPEFKVDVRAPSNNSDAILRIANSSASHHLTMFPGRSGDPNPFIQWADGDPLRFATDAGDFGYDEKMRITSDGEVGICTDSPDEKLHVMGNALIQGEKLITLPWSEGNLTIKDSLGYQMAFDGKTMQSYKIDGFSYDTLFIQPEGGDVNIGNGALVIDDVFYPGLVSLVHGKIANTQGPGFSPSLNFYDYFSSSPGLALTTSNGEANIFNRIAGKPMNFGTNNTVRMKLFSNGDLELVAGKLWFSNQEYIGNGGVYVVEVNGALASTLDNVDDLGSASKRWDDVYATNGVIQTSDARDKTNIQDLDYGLTTVLNLHPVRYEWKDKPQQGEKLGLIAQELLEIVPEIVKTHDTVRAEDGGTEEVELERLGVNYSDLIPVLINAIQEQQAVIEEMQQRLNDLESAVND